MAKNVLIIAAHPDDETLGAGGTIARLSKEGCRVSIAILGEGATSRGGGRKTAVAKLKAGAAVAAKALGARIVLHTGLLDNRFDTIPLLDIVKLVEKEMLNVRPEVVFTHSKADLNIDHVITHRAVLTAARPAAMPFVKEIYAFEVPSSTEWAFGQFGSFNPSVFVDVKDTLKLKLKAMAAYASEIGKFPHPRSAEALKALAATRGSASGMECAEAFELVRMRIG